MAVAAVRLLWILVLAASALQGCGAPSPDPDADGVDSATAEYPEVPDVATDPVDEPAGDVASPPDVDAGDSPSPEGDDGGCHPAHVPVCHSDEALVSCDLAVGNLHGDGRNPTSPRRACESTCSAGSGAEHLNGFYCIETAGCWSVEGLECDACCTLSNSPPPAFHDGDPCTADYCSGATCSHVPYSWIGEACDTRNDYGSCPGALVCDPSCPLYSGYCPTQRCTARTPDADVVNGVDDDCDGATDEGSNGEPLRLTEDGMAGNPSIAALPDGRFVVAWQTASFESPVSLTLRVHLRVGTGADPLGGAPVTLAEGQAYSPCVWPLADGLFAASWVTTDDDDLVAGPVSIRHVRILDGAAEPPRSRWEHRFGDDWMDRGCEAAVTWPDGTMALWVAADGADPSDRYRLQRYDNNGPAGAPIRLPGAGSRQLRLLGATDGRILAAWQSASVEGPDRTTFLARWYGPDGTPLTEAFPLTGETYRSHGAASGPILAELPGKGALATWSARPIYDDGLYFRTVPVPSGGVPDSAPVPFKGEPVGRPEVVGMSVWGGIPLFFWEDLPKAANPTSLHAVWLDPATFLPLRHRVIATPANGILDEAQIATLADGTVVIVWVYDTDSMAGGLSGMRLALVPRVDR